MRELAREGSYPSFQLIDRGAVGTVIKRRGRHNRDAKATESDIAAFRVSPCAPARHNLIQETKGSGRLGRVEKAGK